MATRSCSCYKGLKLWEGSNKEIMDSHVKELNDFIFSSSLMRDAKIVDEAIESGQLDEEDIRNIGARGRSRATDLS